MFHREHNKIRLATSYLVLHLEAKGLYFPDESQWGEAASTYQWIYSALTILMTDIVKKVFKGKFPGMRVAQTIFSQAHPYFAFVLHDEMGHDDFCMTYHFVRATWDVRYTEP